MSKISIQNLTFYYDGSYENIFENVSFQIDTDWKLGFVGRNGRGKTTFLNLLCGKHEYIGNISANVEFDYFPYEIKDKSINTIDVVENIYPQYEFWELSREWSYLNGTDDIWYRPFNSLSNGEQTKVMLVILFLKKNNFLLIDEPTNHLDSETRKTVSDYLNKKSGFILVSHDRTFLDGCIDHVLSINKNSIAVLSGNFTTWWENKKRQDVYETAENDRLRKDIKRLNTASRQAGNWADMVEDTKIGKKSEKYEKCIDTRCYVGEKSRRMQKRRKNLERRMQNEIDEKTSLLKDIETVDDLKVVFEKYHKNVLIDVKDLYLYYGEKQISKKLNFQVRQGECVVLSGNNGCGKSSLIKLILHKNGQDKISPPDYTGNIEVGAGVKISYVSQDISHLSGKISDYIYEQKLDETLFKQFLRKMDFSRSHFDKRIEELSEGQKKKILLASSLCDKAHLYVWDEPLNYIDVFSRMQLETLISYYKPTMIIVEHDKSFVDKISTEYVEM